MNIVLDEDGRMFDKTTGEIIATKEEIKEIYENKLKDTFYETYLDLQNLNIKTDINLIKYKGQKYKCVSIKYGYTFGKVFRVTLRDIMKKGILSKNARLFIGTFEPFIYFPTNSITINEGTPSMKELEDIIGLKKTRLYATIKELEEQEIIKRVKRDGQTIIYFNPFLYCSGGYVLKDTYDLFKNSKYNPNINKDIIR